MRRKSSSCPHCLTDCGGDSKKSWMNFWALSWMKLLRLLLPAASTASQRHKVPMFIASEIKQELADKTYPWTLSCAATAPTPWPWPELSPSVSMCYPWHLSWRAPTSEAASPWHVFYNPPADRQEALPVPPYQTSRCAGIYPKYKNSIKRQRKLSVGHPWRNEFKTNQL